MDEQLFHLHKDLESRHWWFVGRRRILGAIVDRLMQSKPNGQIVDVGCGTGGMTHFLAKRYNCYGVDSSELAIRLARELYPGCRFICDMLPESLNAGAEKAGLYILGDVLEHVRDDRGFLERLIDLTNPSSDILITVPAKRALWSGHDVTAGHHRRYELADLQELVRGLPVDTLLMSFFNSRLYLPILAVRRLTQAIGKTAGADGTDFRIPPGPVNRLLTAILGGETDRLTGALEGLNTGYRTGVSLIAVLRRRPI